MKKILLCIFLYVIVTSMLIITLFLPGNIQKNQHFFLYLYAFMVIVGVAWIIKSTFFVIIAPWYSYIWMGRKRYFARRDYKPLVSVIIPAWNEEVGLVATIKTILANSYRPLEIVVVNDGSTDRSDKIMRAFIQKYLLHIQHSRNYVPIIYHYQPNGGKGSALNTGIALSHGDIIMTFDADSVIHEDAIHHFVSYFSDPEVMAAAGNIQIGNTRTILGLVQSLEYVVGFQKKKAEALLGVVFVIGGAAGAFRRDVFNRLGGYHTGTLTEDLDLSLRIQEAGMRIVYVPEAIVHTEGPTTLSALLRQRLRWKRGRLEAFRLHKSSFFGRKKGSNKTFFWIILPLVIIEDVEIVFDTVYSILLYVYSFLTNSFFILLLAIGLSAMIFFLQLIDNKGFRKFSMFFVVPLIWFLFQIVMFVELHSLARALYTFYRKREVKWQKWQRTGVSDS